MTGSDHGRLASTPEHRPCPTGRRRLACEEHTARPWRIHEITPDFTVEDVWSLHTPGGPDQLADLVSQVVSTDFPQNAPVVVRLLWAARWRIGAALGWDRADAGLGARVVSLHERLPADLRDLPPGLSFDERFATLYQLEDEWAAELANRTVHTVMHLGWVPAEKPRLALADGPGGYQGQMAVLVKPNGVLGKTYLRTIKPLRHLLVYPALIRGIEHRWHRKHVT